MKKPKILKTELVRNKITVSITKAECFFDIIAEGKIEDLAILKEKLKLDTLIYEKGVYGKPCIVIDTCDEFGFAKELMRNILWRINKEIKEWI